jgi:dTDP-4-dehydrorhamnose reductase
MKILVLGSKGQLGRCLLDQSNSCNHEIIFTSRNELDIEDMSSTEATFCLINPDIVINATAYTSVDEAEGDPIKADLINNLAVSNMAETCANLDCWLIHISTDYVFDGNASTPYLESNMTNPQSVYGASKLAGERSVIAANPKYLIVRTSWIFSEYGNNFMKTMLRLGSQLKDIDIVDDQIGCPTYAQDLAKAVFGMISRLDDNRVSGIYHYCGTEPCTWFEFANEIFFQAKRVSFATPIKITPIKTSEYLTRAKRPAYSVLDCTKVYNVFKLPLSNWRDGIKAVLAKSQALN